MTTLTAIFLSIVAAISVWTANTRDLVMNRGEIDSTSTKKAISSKLQQASSSKPASVWKTYIDKQHLYQLDYINEWKPVSEAGDGAVVFSKLKSTASAAVDGGSELSVDVIKTELPSIEDWFKSEYSDRDNGLLPSTSTVMLGDIPAMRINDPVSEGGCDERFTAIKDGLLILIDRGSASCDYVGDIYTRILSSFKLLK